MNRNGLIVALAVAVVVGVPFGLYPQLDVAIAALFFDPTTHLFPTGYENWVMHSRDAARWIVALIVAPAILAIIGKLILPQRRMLIGGRAALLLVVALLLGPGIIANAILKDHWGRSRPIDIVQFGGPDQFSPWWDARRPCRDNCSFIAGEPSGAFWTFAPAALTPPQWRVLAYGAVIVFGAADGVLRMAGGGHFFTDVVFAGVFMYLVVWTLHGLIYRWRPTCMTDDAVERPLTRAGEAIRNGLVRLRRRRDPSG